MDLSVCIPYYQRRQQLTTVLKCLAAQATKGLAYEVIIATPDRESDSQQALEGVSGLRVRVAPFSGGWNVARARNEAIATARGRVLLLLDADIALESDAVQRHFDRHRNEGYKESVLLGAVRGYDKMATSDGSESCERLLFGGLFRDTLGTPDRRERIDVGLAALPWALCWTGHLSIPAERIKRHGVFFDDSFTGWGMEDQEWAFRLLQRNFKIEFAADIRGYHLPHPRDVSANLSQERCNLRRFLAKHPCFGVELVALLGDVEANREHASLLQLLTRSSANLRCERCEPSDSRSTQRIVYFGRPSDAFVHGSVILDATLPALGPGQAGCATVFPLLGAITPFEDERFDRAIVSEAVWDLPSLYREAALREATRIARTVRHGSSGLRPPPQIATMKAWRKGPT